MPRLMFARPAHDATTLEELARRKALADEADRIRAAFGPLGFSAVDVIREARDDNDPGRC